MKAHFLLHRDRVVIAGRGRSPEREGWRPRQPMVVTPAPLRAVSDGDMTGPHLCRKQDFLLDEAVPIIADR
jgi:hypothetical protein